jgi:hypothetical protein
MSYPDIYGPIDAVYQQRYADNVRLQVQLTRDPFDGAYEIIPNARGREIQAVDLVGKSECLFDQPDDAPTPNIPPSHEGIYAQPRKMNWGRLIKRGDEIKAAVDFQSIYVREGAAALVRGKAKLLAAALVGPRLIRNDNTGAINSVPYDQTNRVIANNYQYGGGGATAGLTVQKWIKAMEMLGKTDLDVDTEDLTAAMTMKENTDLYNQLQVTNMLYVNRAQFEEKTVKVFMGVRIKIYNYLPMDPTGAYRQIPMWARSGLHWGDFEPLATFLERNPSLNFQPHAYLEQWGGATRSEDEKVVLINCDPTVQ